MGSDSVPFAEGDLALFDRVAARVVELRAEIPAILTLESLRPLTVVASQAMIFFEPLVQSLFRFSEYRRFAILLERRESIEVLIQRIEAAAAAAHGSAKRTPR